MMLNAASRLQYHPYWWRFERQVKLEGEVFLVKPGTLFKVVSEKGTTEVLGTEFNIYSREKNYSVFCQSGTVKVIVEKLNTVWFYKRRNGSPKKNSNFKNLCSF